MLGSLYQYHTIVVLTGLFAGRPSEASVTCERLQSVTPRARYPRSPGPSSRCSRHSSSASWRSWFTRPSSIPLAPRRDSMDRRSCWRTRALTASTSTASVSGYSPRRTRLLIFRSSSGGGVSVIRDGSCRACYASQWEIVSTIRPREGQPYMMELFFALFSGLLSGGLRRPLHEMVYAVLPQLAKS